MTSKTSDAGNSFDVLMIGAGISGVNAAYRVQTELPNYSYTILESRAAMGGTWDFFKYPGLRSDSDLHTFGFPWEPWTQAKSIADGGSICDYIRNTAAKYGIDKHVQYHRRVTSADWSSDQQRWRLTVLVNGEKEVQYYARFVILSTGYYNYNEPLPTKIPGLENFKGQVVHPQFWPEDLDYSNKRIVIIGSGATAVTLLPNVAKKAKHVTMLQRSPGYLMSLPQKDNPFLRKILPTWLAHRVTRMYFLIVPFMFFKFCRAYPKAARVIMQKRTEPQLPKNVPHDPHFKPSYNPWEQRLCLCPNGDFFEALRDGNASVATGHIETMTDNQIILKSGERLDADLIVTATGLKVQMAGGASVSVDGKPIDIAEKFIWKGMLLQDLPNAAFVVGYTNASWTLGSDATAMHLCRIIKSMEKKGETSVVPRVEHPENIKEQPLLNLTSTYITAAPKVFPKAGDKGPWQPRSNYFVDWFVAKFGNISDGLQFSRVST